MTSPVDRIRRFHPELTAIRRDLHAHPELSFNEQRTSGVVAEYLRKLGIETHVGLAKTGVVGVIPGKTKGGKGVGLRADMDCLPMHEQNSFPHKSSHEGRMHACGHDGHTTMLLGAARYLAETRNFDGTAYVIFQPAEEGGGGGQVMVQEGLFERFPADEVYAVHNWPGLPAGQMAVRAGPVMAATDEVQITLRGRGGHAAMPHLVTDPVVAAAQVITRAADHRQPQRQPGRRRGGQHLLDADQPARRVQRGARPRQAGRHGAQLPPGDARPGREAAARNRRPTSATRLALPPKSDYSRGYPATINSAREAQFAARVGEHLFGKGNVITEHEPTMGGEDFSYMLQARPGAYVFLGQGGAPGGCFLHNPGYDFNDEVIPLGAGYLASLVEEALPIK